MREKIKNQLLITCEDIDLTTLTNIEFYVRQINFFKIYKPIVTSASTMIVEIPFEDARKLREGNIKLQFAFVDEHGNPNASEIIDKTVNGLLKEVGYDPI